MPNEEMRANARKLSSEVRRRIARSYCLLRSPDRAQRRIYLLMYHGIEPRSDRNWGPRTSSVPPETFESHLARIAESRPVASVPDLVDWLSGTRELPDGTVVITIDDGYGSVIKRALPKLEQYETPATVYVSSKLVESQTVPYQFRLEAALDSSSKVSVSLEDFFIEERLDSESDRAAVYESIRKHVQSNPADKKAVLSTLEPIPETGVRMLTTPELRTLAEHPLITVGCHSHRHVPLERLSRVERAEELKVAKRYLEGLLDGRVDHFCYPYGSWNASIARAVERSGFSSAVTTEPRPVPPWEDQFSVGRFDAARSGLPWK